MSHVVFRVSRTVGPLASAPHPVAGITFVQPHPVDVGASTGEPKHTVTVCAGK